MWAGLSLIAFVLIVYFFFKGSNAVWYGATIGLIIAILIAIITDFNWALTYKIVLVGTLIGGVSELICSISENL
jgi:hypothetical protein